MPFRFWALAALCLIWTEMGDARAQTTTPDQKALFAAYIGSPGYKAYLEQAFNFAEAPVLKKQCASLRLVEWDKVLIIEQPTFVRSGPNFNVDSGAWVARAVLDRCGVHVTRRALLKAVPGKNILEPTFLLPGDFRGNLKLEQDARLIVLPGLGAVADCRDFATVRVLDVKSLTPSSPQGWSEVWTAEACDKIFDTTVTYSTTTGGMNVSAPQWKLR